MGTHKIKRVFLLAVSCCFAQLQCAAQTKQTGAGIIKMMHERYFNGICRSYTFSQKNIHYRNDSIVKYSDWHEAIEYPDKLRIDFGDKTLGNFVTFKNDSVFNYKKNQLFKAQPDSNILLLLIGGMYYRNLDDVLLRIKHAKIDLLVLSEQKWNGNEVFVIGAIENNMTVNQIWIDKKTLIVLRIIERLNEKNLIDIGFEAHQKLCRGFVETKVSFRRNGRLEKIEEYSDIKEGKGF